MVKGTQWGAGGWLVVLIVLIIWLSLLVLFCFLTRVGSNLIILNISDLEVFQPQKIFIFGWIGPLDKKSQNQLARPLASNRFCILRERSSAPIHLRNFMLLTSIRQYGRPFGNNSSDLLRCELCLRKNCVLLR